MLHPIKTKTCHTLQTPKPNSTACQSPWLALHDNDSVCKIVILHAHNQNKKRHTTVRCLFWWKGKENPKYIYSGLAFFLAELDYLVHQAVLLRLRRRHEVVAVQVLQEIRSVARMGDVGTLSIYMTSSNTGQFTSENTISELQVNLWVLSKPLLLVTLGRLQQNKKAAL